MPNALVIGGDRIEGIKQCYRLRESIKLITGLAGN